MRLANFSTFVVVHPGMGQLRLTLLARGRDLDLVGSGFGVELCICGRVVLSVCKVVATFFALVASHGRSGSFIP